MNENEGKLKSSAPQHDTHEDVEYFGDTGIGSKHAPVPRWLLFTYIFMPIFGVIWWLAFWNGSEGWFDRGYWQQLQRAARTTYPFQTGPLNPEPVDHTLPK